MQPSGFDYCDVSLPVPLDQAFTYSLPETLRLRASVGARVVAPFGARKLAGVIIARHNRKPDYVTRPIQRLLDEEPALTEDLLALGKWIADYYQAPLGEVFRAMLPPPAELRAGKNVSLTPTGVEALHGAGAETKGDLPLSVLRALEKRPLSAAYLNKKIPGAENAVRTLRRKGFLNVESTMEDRDPLLQRGGRLLAALRDDAPRPEKLTRGEARVLELLADERGPHDVETLKLERKDAASVVRRLAKQGLVRLWKQTDDDQPGSPSSAFADQRRPPTLNPDQQTALEAISDSLSSSRFEVFLLHGVTSSGKTEVYLRAIECALSAGKSSLLLVPEISLTPAMAGQFFARFGDQVAILHSAFSGRERSSQWRRLRDGRARIAVGTRSAVFAPVENLGLVIVDEEHDSSYKQGETPRYHGRDVAMVRARNAGASVVLGSATPSLESRFNVERGKYRLLELPERIERRPLPSVKIIDMAKEFAETHQQHLFSRALSEAIRERLASGEQVMMLLNRRGFSNFVSCRRCGERIECENCSVTLTYHRGRRVLLCHYCDYSRPAPKKCPKCDSEHIYFIGSGSEKVEDYLRQEFPRARIARLDRDAARGRGRYEAILGGFREGAYDILVGTQMIAKGHDIPNVTLVGVVSADVGLGMPDFRAAERTFQLLTQVAGRAGRGSRPGLVLFQTINPDHYAIRLAAAQDYAAFYKQELHFRRMLRYPPFTAAALIVVRAKKLEDALKLSGRLGQQLKNAPPSVRMIGPAAAPVVKLKSDFRYQFFLKASSRKALAQVLKQARKFALAENWPAAALVIDVDPTSLL